MVRLIGLLPSCRKPFKAVVNRSRPRKQCEHEYEDESPSGGSSRVNAELQTKAATLKKRAFEMGAAYSPTLHESADYRVKRFDWFRSRGVL